jgi:hypothetical protein
VREVSIREWLPRPSRQYLDGQVYRKVHSCQRKNRMTCFPSGGPGVSTRRACELEEIPLGFGITTISRQGFGKQRLPE